MAIPSKDGKGIISPLVKSAKPKTNTAFDKDMCVIYQNRTDEPIHEATTENMGVQLKQIGDFFQFKIFILHRLKYTISAKNNNLKNHASKQVY